MNKKPVPGRKTFRLIAAYSRLPREGRTFLDWLVEYLAVIDGERGIAAKPKKMPALAAFPKTNVLEKP